MGKAPFVLAILLLPLALPVASAVEWCTGDNLVRYSDCVGADAERRSAWYCSGAQRSICRGVSVLGSDALHVYDDRKWEKDHFWTANVGGNASLAGDWDFNPMYPGFGERTTFIVVAPNEGRVYVGSTGDHLLGETQPLNVRLDASAAGASADLYVCLLYNFDGSWIGLGCGDLADGQVRPQVTGLYNEAWEAAMDYYNWVRQTCPNPPRCLTTL